MKRAAAFLALVCCSPLAIGQSSDPVIERSSGHPITRSPAHPIARSIRFGPPPRWARKLIVAEMMQVSGVSPLKVFWSRGPYTVAGQPWWAIRLQHLHYHDAGLDWRWYLWFNAYDYRWTRKRAVEFRAVVREALEWMAETARTEDPGLRNKRQCSVLSPQSSVLSPGSSQSSALSPESTLEF